MRHGVMRDDPAPGHDMPIDIRIADRLRRAQQRYRVGEQRHQQRPGQAQPQAGKTRARQIGHQKRPEDPRNAPSHPSKVDEG